MNDNAKQTPSTPAFRLFQPDKPALALGLAVNHLMTKPAFANLRFGDWSKILVGQINRGHYRFVIDDNMKVQGFAGWALATRENAEAWVEGRRNLSYQNSLAGECMVCNVWSANTTKVHRFMFDEARNIMAGKETIYYKRHYADGRIRQVRMNVSDFVRRHIRQNSPPSIQTDEPDSTILIEGPLEGRT